MNGVLATKGDLRAWAARLGLTPPAAARALGLAQPGYNAKLYGTRPIDHRTRLLAAYYEANPEKAERILAETGDKCP